MTTWSSIKTYALVTVVTLLIWVWAEAESLTTVPVSPRVELSTTGTDVTARILDASWNGTVRMRIRGSSASVSAAQSRLAMALTLSPGIGSVPASPGEHVISLPEALRSHPELARLGVNFLDVEPATVRVQIDELATREADVQAVLPGVDVEGEAVVSPKRVTVRVRKSDAGSLPAVLTASATPDPDALAALSGDGPHTIAARVSVPSLPSWIGPVTLEPARATVTFSRRRSAETLVVAQAPVWVVLTPADAARWEVTPTPAFVSGVRVSGRRDLLEQVRGAPDGVRAYVMLNGRDLREGEITAPVVFSTAPTSLKFECDTPTVKLTVKERGS